MLSKPFAAVQSATSASGVSGNGAVSRPSLIGRPAPAAGSLAASRWRGDVDPAPGPGALGDRVADEHLVVAVGERGVRRPVGGRAGQRRRRRSARNSAPNVSAKPSTWPPGSAAAACPAGPISAGLRSRISFGSLAVAEPQLVGRLRVPGGRAVEPSISHWSEFFRPALICEIATEPRAPFVEPQQDRGHVLGRHRALDRVAGSLRREGLDRAASARWRGRDERREVGHHRGDRLAGHERHEVEPVRADVADRPEGAALVRLQPPVPVGLEEQPVLEVAAGHEPDVAEAAGARRARGRAGGAGRSGC